MREKEVGKCGGAGARGVQSDARRCQAVKLQTPVVPRRCSHLCGARGGTTKSQAKILRALWKSIDRNAVSGERRVISRMALFESIERARSILDAARFELWTSSLCRVVLTNAIAIARSSPR